MSKKMMVVEMLKSKGLKDEWSVGLGELYDEIEKVIEGGEKKYVSVEMIKRRMLKDVLEKVFGCDVDGLRRERKVRSLEERLEDMDVNERRKLLEKYMK